jgi:hypothetical protein
MCQASEHDSVLLYSARQGESVFTDPHSTGVVNSAIELFSVALSLHAPKVQESSVEQIATFLSSAGLQRNPGRKAAMIVNISVALLHTLKVAVREGGSSAGKLSPTTEKVFQELIQVCSSSLMSSFWALSNHSRNSSPILIRLSGQLAWKPSDVYVKLPETLSLIPK